MRIRSNLSILFEHLPNIWYVSQIPTEVISKMVEGTEPLNTVTAFTQIKPVPNVLEYLLFSSLLLLGLSACGSTDEPMIVKQEMPVAAIPSASNPVLSITANSTSQSLLPTTLLDYPLGSEEKMVFDAINAARSVCGFGAVFRNEALDFSISGHMGYLLQNNMWGHNETKQANSVSYVGATPQDRAQSKGYFGSVGEALVGRLTTYQGGGLRGLGGLTTAAYHLVDLFRPYGDIGLIVAEAGTSNIFSGNITLGIQYGYARKSAAVGIRTYPCNGITVLETKTYATEWPNPLPNRDAGLQPLGHPVFIRGTENSPLILTLAEIRKSSDTQPIEVVILNTNNDPNRILQAWEAVVIPLQTLQPRTVYEVKFVGSDNGLSFERRFTFETAAL